MRVPPPVIALTAALVQRSLARDAGPAPAARRAAAAATAAGSAALMGTAMREFRRAGTTVDPLHPERASSLVDSGPFRVTRNPRYVGMAGLLAAHATVRGRWRTVVPVLGFVLLIDRVQIPPEEAAMASLFEDDYDAYRSRVRRWL